MTVDWDSSNHSEGKFYFRTVHYMQNMQKQIWSSVAVIILQHRLHRHKGAIELLVFHSSISLRLGLDLEQLAHKILEVEVQKWHRRRELE